MHMDSKTKELFLMAREGSLKMRGRKAKTKKLCMCCGRDLEDA